MTDSRSGVADADPVTLNLVVLVGSVEPGLQTGAVTVANVNQRQSLEHT